jgi:hypothetical protein
MMHLTTALAKSRGRVQDVGYLMIRPAGPSERMPTHVIAFRDSTMFRVLAVVALAYSYLQVETGLPEIATRRPGIAITVWTLFAIGVLMTAVLLSVPFIARSSPEMVHFGWRRLSDYTPEQLRRILPLLRTVVGLMALAS